MRIVLELDLGSTDLADLDEITVRLATGAESAVPCPPPVRTWPGPGLTTREREVLTLVADGMSNRAIAGRLFLSPRTVEKHVERLLAKTGRSNRAQLVSYNLRASG